MRTTQAFTIPIAFFALLFSWSQNAVAQQAGSFEQLTQRLKPGETLIVTTDDGSKIKGRMIEISAGHIQFQMKDGERSVPAERIARVQHYRNGVLLGAVIGAAAGVPAALGLAEYANNEGGNAAAAAIPIVIGMGIGIGIDSFLKMPRTVYRSEAPARVTASPILDRNRRGVMLAINF